MMVWKFIHKKIQKREKVMLLTVITHHGSSPGKTGFKMAVTTDGAMTGSIGGGIMEHRMVTIARETLKKETIQNPFIRQQLHDADGENGSGLVCSGQQTIAFVTLTEKDEPTIAALTKDKEGTLIIDENGFYFQSGSVPSNQFTLKTTAKQHFRYIEHYGYRKKLFIIGGGHVSLALSKVMRDLDFHITVFDNRDDLTTFTDNQFAHEKRVINYNRLDKLIPEGHDIYVALMTFSHKTDELALKKIIDKEIAYIGMLGSEKKVQLIGDHLGLTTFPDYFHAPIGLVPHCVTPQEIAISIAGEIISHF